MLYTSVADLRNGLSEWHNSNSQPFSVASKRKVRDLMEGAEKEEEEEEDVTVPRKIEDFISPLHNDFLVSHSMSALRCI